MKLEDVTAIQTVVTDLAVLIDVNQRCHLAEQRLALAVDALRKIEDTDNYGPDGCWDADSYPDEIARDAIARIEEKT